MVVDAYNEDVPVAFYKKNGFDFMFSTEEQEKSYLSGASRAKWGKSKHNANPSLAVDVVPLPLNWDNIESFEKLGKVIMETAEMLNIKIKWGRDFKKLKDYPHFELV